MTLDDYIHERIRQLDVFRDNWREQQREHGLDRWPEEMAPGDWDEQFKAFWLGE